MDIPLDEVIHFDAITSSSTGAATDADSTPSFAIYEESTDTAIVSGNFTKRTSLTGNYRGTATLTAANGFEVGKWYTVIASATVGGVAAKAAVMAFRVSLAEATAGARPVSLIDDAITSSSLAASAGTEIADAVVDEIVDRGIATEFTSPVLSNSEIDIVQNSDYYTADGRDLEFVFTRAYVPSQCTLKIASGSTITITSTDITQTSGSGSGRFSVRFQIARTDGDDLDAGYGTFQVFSTIGAREVPEVAEGKAIIRRRLA